jgi:hypothetical protein
MNGELITMLLSAHFCGSAIRTEVLQREAKMFPGENEQNGRQNAKNSDSNPPSKQGTGPGYLGITDRGTLVLLATAEPGLDAMATPDSMLH